ncbi:MAG: molecular chaperone HtpG [Lachnospiraceae bacterium]|uniref:Molecular chaperone HtpG n=1 Tax=Hominisplanchenecus murintestinalis TaxID=2941517 RepID=A0AC61QVF0_9FIRM|nr:molecular chaperone HtpG [Hominisplanchenecus murintestinalis]MCI9517158.1 molecular chaperone HtpG [Lachnospiraceae bacterium]RKJ90891.1 molecular chaperone HtpG [Anaerotruncus sp. 1XD22-93]MCI9661584.1 molecular chaperone HtpG [Lachnospiraceae bacterium]MDE6907444.1 molecular chaperone HtpG [Lachnospiraceae bacterium]NBI75670.1 molecular chaperone HtpG [Lachnospiraceae bacterium]
MSNRTGSLSINSENIFPIIKKWLYSDHDIFARELVSNGCDAITKLKKLEMMGEYTFPEKYKAKIEVIVNPEEKTLKFIDTGLGMTAEEVEEYITQIAFSGATDFLEKYKDKTNDDEMIGHFGLGFYSAFMVADEVHIDTLSYKEGASPVHWECDGGTEYTIDDGSRTAAGTEITLFLNEESLEFANEYRMREVLQKYCSFMPVEIFLSNANAEQQYETIDESELTEEDVVVEHIHEEAKTEEQENEDGEKEVVEISPAKDKVKIHKRPVSISDIHPLWTKHPNECSDEEYREFYRKVFLDYKEPLFWIHLNMDYPFNLKGILYFPKINTEYDSIEGTIKLYNNQVFIADNIKEVIPEFLMLLKGVIDCPDLPLNVSRSALQNDGFVKKISEYISKKVADKLSGMCKTDRENYEKYWDDISPFIKFGCIKDSKFSDKMMDYILYKNLEDKYLTFTDFVAENKKEEPEAEVVEESKTGDEGEEEKPKTKLYYVTDEVQQSQYINMFKEQGMDAVLLKHNIDSAFISHVEQKHEDVKFLRIDADVTESMREEISEEELKEEKDTLTEVFRKALGRENLEVKVEKLKNENISSMMTLSEENRRMQDMMKMYGMGGMDPSMFGGQETLVLNANNKLVQYIFENKDSEHVPMICGQLYDLAMLSHKQLAPEQMTKFIARSNEILALLTK